MSTPSSIRPPLPKTKSGLFSKIKQVFKKKEDPETRSIGPVATKRISRRSSIFTTNREVKEAMEAERIRAERKSKCLAIAVANRDPPAIQRLLVDCEFCNPPPKFGRTVMVPTANFTSDSSNDALEELLTLESKGTIDLQDEMTWNVGLDYWMQIRKWWLTQNEHKVEPHYLEPELTSDKFYTVYDKLVYHTRPFKHPLNLGDAIKIVKAGWIGEGTWPDVSDDDVWSTTDAEEVKASKEAKQKSKHENIAIEVEKVSESSGEHDDDDVIQQDEPRVQFTDQPHPKGGADVSKELQPLERYTSGMESLRPIRSTQSSMVSITDSE